MGRFVERLDDLVAPIEDGAILALPPDYSSCAMAAVAALIARGPRRLHLVGVPTLGLQGDQLIAAGAVYVAATRPARAA